MDIPVEMFRAVSAPSFLRRCTWHFGRLGIGIFEFRFRWLGALSRLPLAVGERKSCVKLAAAAERWSAGSRFKVLSKRFL